MAGVLSDQQLQFAIEDARERHAALLRLIYHIDTLAMSLLGLVSVIGIATGSAAAALFGAKSSFTIPLAWPLAWALVGATAMLIIGAIFCFLSMQTVKVSLPGRGPEFWLWALDNRVNWTDVWRSYLENLQEASAFNRRINQSASDLLMGAKISIILAPAIALGSGIMAGIAS